MAFHLFNLGSLSATLQEYADSEGLIPEKDDLWQDFKWPHKLQKTFADKENGEAYWRDFLAKAIAATLKAEQALENLEKYDGWYRGKRHRH